MLHPYSQLIQVHFSLLTNQMNWWQYNSSHCRLGNFRIAFFDVRNVFAFNFRNATKWWILNVRVTIFLTFNFRRLSNWWRIFNSENFPIYGIKTTSIVKNVVNNTVFEKGSYTSQRLFCHVFWLHQSIQLMLRAEVTSMNTWCIYEDYTSLAMQRLLQGGCSFIDK